MATFDEKSRNQGVGEEKDPNSTCVDSAIHILEQNPDIIQSQFSSVSVGLHYIQEFLTSVRYWNSHEDARPRFLYFLGDAVSRIEDAFETTSQEIGNAIEKGDAELLNTVLCKLRNKIKLFKAIIRKSYYSVNFYGSYDKEVKGTACVIKKISEEYYLADNEEWEIVRRGLELIRTFVSIAYIWSDLDEAISQKVEGFKDIICNYVIMVGQGIETAIADGDGDGLDALSSNLQKKIEMWKPMIREAYDFIIDHIFRFDSRSVSFIGDRDWNYVTENLDRNAEKVLFNIWDNDDLRRDFYGILCLLEYLGRFTKAHRNSNERIWRLAVLFQWAAMNVARILFLGWADEMDPKDVIYMISDLLQRIKPDSPE